MFKDGGKGLIVHVPQWNGARGYIVATIGKVHKTGRLTLSGDPKEQWRQVRAVADGSDFFVRTGDSYTKGRLYPWSAELVAEIDAEREMHDDRMKLNKLGDILSKIRDDEQGSKIWQNLLADVKELIE